MSIRAQDFSKALAKVAALGLLALGFSSAGGATPFRDLRGSTHIQGDAGAGEKKAATCFACHGANGASIAPNFPRLAGQRPVYLYDRLVSFKQAKPKDPYYSISPMTAMAAPLSDTDMRDLAVFFAGQQPQASSGADAAPHTEAGASIFLNGDTSRGIPPCQGCHGTDANGSNIHSGQYAAYPALRGQYDAYLVARLTNFRKGLPNTTSNDFVMAGVAYNLDDASIQAIAAYLSSLSPAKSF